MEGYFLTLITASLFGVVCSIFAGEKFERYMKYISSLVCVCLVLLPLVNIDPEKAPEGFEISFPEDVNTPDKDLNALAEKLTESNAEKYIIEIVFENFGIKPLSAGINIDWTEKTPLIREISLTLSKKDFPQKETVGDYLRKTLSCEVTVIEG